MRKIVVIFGLISGAISSLMMIALVTFRVGFDQGAVINNTSIVLSFLMVFFGIRTYRDDTCNGQIYKRGSQENISPSTGSKNGSLTSSPLRTDRRLVVSCL
jgi:hypothetical protein